MSDRDDNTDDNTDDSTDDNTDPRTKEPIGDEGVPGELVDTPHNLPGDQPEDDTPPSRIKATGRD